MSGEHVGKRSAFICSYEFRLNWPWVHSRQVNCLCFLTTDALHIKIRDDNSWQVCVIHPSSF